MENKEKRTEPKEEFLQNRLEDVLKKFYLIHELRWQLGSMYCDTSEESYQNYFEANELLGEFEKHLWEYLRGEKDNF